MQIRHATLEDLDELIRMLKNYANATPLTCFEEPIYDEHRVKTLLANFMMRHLVLVGEVDEGLGGLLIANMVPDIWMPHIVTLRETAWWVEEECRNTSMGYRLLQEYLKIGKRLREENVVQEIVLTTMVNSPDLKLEKRGWRTIETNYVYEGV